MAGTPSLAVGLLGESAGEKAKGRSHAGSSIALTCVHVGEREVRRSEYQEVRTSGGQERYSVGEHDLELQWRCKRRSSKGRMLIRFLLSNRVYTRTECVLSCLPCTEVHAGRAFGSCTG